MPEPSVTLEASQIDGAILFIAISLGLVAVLILIEAVEALIKIKKRK